MLFLYENKVHLKLTIYNKVTSRMEWNLLTFQLYENVLEKQWWCSPYSPKPLKWRPARIPTSNNNIITKINIQNSQIIIQNRYEYFDIYKHILL